MVFGYNSYTIQSYVRWKISSQLHTRMDGYRWMTMLAKGIFDVWPWIEKWKASESQMVQQRDCICHKGVVERYLAVGQYPEPFVGISIFVGWLVMTPVVYVCNMSPNKCMSGRDQARPLMTLGVKGWFYCNFVLPPPWKYWSMFVRRCSLHVPGLNGGQKSSLRVGRGKLWLGQQGNLKPHNLCILTKCKLWRLNRRDNEKLEHCKKNMFWRGSRFLIPLNTALFHQHFWEFLWSWNAWPPFKPPSDDGRCRSEAIDSYVKFYEAQQGEMMRDAWCRFQLGSITASVPLMVKVEMRPEVMMRWYRFTHNDRRFLERSTVTLVITLHVCWFSLEEVSTETFGCWWLFLVPENMAQTGCHLKADDTPIHRFKCPLAKLGNSSTQGRYWHCNPVHVCPYHIYKMFQHHSGQWSGPTSDQRAGEPLFCMKKDHFFGFLFSLCSQKQPWNMMEYEYSLYCSIVFTYLCIYLYLHIYIYI